MKLSIRYQEKYSRGELLLRCIPGLLYIYIPHLFILFFMGLWGVFLLFVSFWVILFTGQYPENMFQYLEGLLRWETRLVARMTNISDGYPSFGLKATDERVELEIPYPEQVSQSLTLVRLLLGLIYVIIPHGIILTIRFLFVLILIIIAWFAVLFTARYPRFIYNWVMGQIRWELRLALYMMFMTDTYPPFSGDEFPE